MIWHVWDTEKTECNGGNYRFQSQTRTCLFKLTSNTQYPVKTHELVGILFVSENK
jgi:hypothetical protein